MPFARRSSTHRHFHTPCLTRFVEQSPAVTLPLPKHHSPMRARRVARAGRLREYICRLSDTSAMRALAAGHSPPSRGPIIISSHARQLAILFSQYPLEKMNMSISGDERRQRRAEHLASARRWRRAATRGRRYTRRAHFVLVATFISRARARYRTARQYRVGRLTRPMMGH